MSEDNNAQDKTATEPTVQTESTETRVDSDEEGQNNLTATNSDNDSGGKAGDKTADTKSDDDASKKRLIICCDGTWENAASSVGGGTNVVYVTNVARFARCMDRLEIEGFEVERHGKKVKEHVPQVVWYSGGVGTYASLPSEWIWSGFSGAGVTSTILNAYYFLSSNFNFCCHHDEIILVGYSRGAFTVRCLAEFISEVGLLRRMALPFLGLLFRLWADRKVHELSQLKKVLAPEEEIGKELNLLMEVNIKVLAEFDPVSSIFDPFHRHRGISAVRDKVPSKVQNAFLAMALNEKRGDFEPMLWKTKETEQVVKQCAFLGCHGDIGGGNADSGLSQLPLLWMIAQIQEATSNKTSDGVSSKTDQLLQFATPSAVSQRRKINTEISKREWTDLFETVSLAKGDITESLTLRWKLWDILKGIVTLGLGQVNHDRLLPIVPRESQAVQQEPSGSKTVCPLKIHFSVDLLHKKRGQDGDKDGIGKGGHRYRLGPLQAYNCVRKDDKDHLAGASWNSSASTSSPAGHSLGEEAPGNLEKELLHEWAKWTEQWWAWKKAKEDDEKERGLLLSQGKDSCIGFHSNVNEKESLIYFLSDFFK